MSQRTVVEPVSALRQLIEQYPQTVTVWIGYSGGVDSTALLWLASLAIPKDRLIAVHINHNLQPESSIWVAHCESVARALGVRFVSRSVKPLSDSEESARDARYAAFDELLQKQDLLLLGQHQGDQAETLLMRLFRGTGVQGMAGISRARPFGRGCLLRPLLDYTRSQLELIVTEAGLDWIEDPSNRDGRYLRNWVRDQLSPVLKQRWPEWEARLGSSAQRFAASAQLNLELAQIDAGGGFTNPQPIAEPLWNRTDRLKNLLYYWLRDQRVQPGSARQMELIIEQLQTLREQAHGNWEIGSARLHIYQGQLWLQRSPVNPLRPRALVLAPGRVALDTGSILVEPADCGFETGLPVLLRSRQPGDYIERSFGRVSIKKLMNEKKLPPWLRDSWPLLEYQGEIISVVGIWDSPAAKKEGGLRINWVR